MGKEKAPKAAAPKKATDKGSATVKPPAPEQPKPQEPLDLTQSGLSYHMKILCDSGIVVSRQEGKWTHYCLSSSGRDKAVELLKKLTTPDNE